MTKPYQLKTLQQAVNHIQDLYADDIAFKVFNKSKAFTPDRIFNFFLDWIRDKPVNPKSIKDKWLNVGRMLNNCFAISNMARHNIKDIDNQAENKIQKFLSQTDDTIRKEFAYFRNFMINLKQNPAPTQFKEDLTKYLTRIIRLAKDSRKKSQTV